MSANPLPTAGLEIRILPLKQLRPAPYNPRSRLKPSDPAYRKLEMSLRRVRSGRAAHLE